MRLNADIEPLRRDHDVDGFDCGEPQLDRFLIRYALLSQQSDASRSYVAIGDGRAVGYYTLVVGEAEHAQAHQRVAKGPAKHKIPLIVLARLAVRRDWQGRGLGAGLLRDAMARSSRVADQAGVRALAVHAKSESAVAFYSHFGFLRSPTDPLHLFVLMKDIRRMLRS